MSSLLHQLNNESLLLMYLADELPAEDRTEVEHMVERDPQLRVQLDELRAAYAGTREALDAADESDRLALPAGGAARRVGHAVRAWHARRLIEGPREQAPVRRLRFPWWSYPVAAAAAVLFAAVSWWGFQDDNRPMVIGPGIPMAPIDDGNSSTPLVYLPPLPDIPGAGDESDAVLDAAEEELYALSESGGAAVDDPATSFMLMDDTDEQ